MNTILNVLSDTTASPRRLIRAYSTQLTSDTSCYCYYYLMLHPLALAYSSDCSDRVEVELASTERWPRMDGCGGVFSFRWCRRENVTRRFYTIDRKLREDLVGTPPPSPSARIPSNLKCQSHPQRQPGEELWKRRWRTWTTAGAPSRDWPVTDRGEGASLLP